MNFHFMGMKLKKILNSFYDADIVKNILGDDYYNSEAHLITGTAISGKYVSTDIFIEVNNRRENFAFNENGKPYYKGAY